MLTKREAGGLKRRMREWIAPWYRRQAYAIIDRFTEKPKKEKRRGKKK